MNYYHYLLLHTAMMASIVSAGSTAQLMSKYDYSPHAALQIPKVEPCDTDGNDDHAVETNDEDDSRTLDDVDEPSTSSLLRTPSSSPLHPKEVKPGSIVELYSESSFFATPALVLQQHDDDESSSSSYTVENTITHKTIPSLPSHYIHPYQVYPPGTRASCNIIPSTEQQHTLLDANQQQQTTEDQVYMVPCVVTSHQSRHKSGLILYQVSFLVDGTEELVEEWIPFSRVQRIQGRVSGGLRGGGGARR